MSNEVYASMSDVDLLGKLAEMSRYNQRAAFVLAQLTDDEVYSVVTELRRRCARHAQAAFAEEPAGERPFSGHATTFEVSGRRFKTYFANKRIRLSDVSRLVGLDPNWASVICSKGKANVHTLERLAMEIAVEPDELLYAIATDRERQRVGLLR